jgi:hypothetical protein
MIEGHAALIGEIERRFEQTEAEHKWWWPAINQPRSASERIDCAPDLLQWHSCRWTKLSATRAGTLVVAVTPREQMPARDRRLAHRGASHSFSFWQVCVGVRCAFHGGGLVAGWPAIVHFLRSPHLALTVEDAIEKQAAHPVFRHERVAARDLLRRGHDILVQVTTSFAVG